MHTFGDDFLLGGPQADADKVGYLRLLYVHACSAHQLRAADCTKLDPPTVHESFDPEKLPAHHPTHAVVLSHLDGSLSRVTEKSAGLLQVTGILIAISALVTQLETRPAVDSSVWDNARIVFGTAFVVASAICLAMNLGVLWRKKEAEFLATYSYSRFVLDLLAGRCARYVLARYLLYCGGALIVWKFFSIIAPGAIP
ncbi:MAG: hypothetical protein AB7P07_05390 [Hyphomonadaceae bacterium]